MTIKLKPVLSSLEGQAARGWGEDRIVSQRYRARGGAGTCATFGRAENIEMSKLLLDIVRDLKRVNASHPNLD